MYYQEDNDSALIIPTLKKLPKTYKKQNEKSDGAYKKITGRKLTKKEAGYIEKPSDLEDCPPGCGIRYSVIPHYVNLFCILDVVIAFISEENAEHVT